MAQYVYTMNRVGKLVPPKRVILKDISLSFFPGAKIGVLGLNGAGKSSLLRIMAGDDHSFLGEAFPAEGISVGFLQQEPKLDPAKNVWQEISGGAEQLQLGTRQIASRAYVASFNFKGSDQQKRVGDLSGGERNRVHLATMLKSGGNLLLLDEPTNDLDVDTLRALEDALLSFAGCAVVISHDRWFLNRVATHMLAFEGDSRVVWFEGNYEDYEADRHKRLGAAADTPHRIRYKPLTRG